MKVKQNHIKYGYTGHKVKEINRLIGANLACARRNAGLSQTDVMKVIWNTDNNRNRISEIENGRRELTLIDLLIFQDLYGQSLDYICGLSIEPEIDMLAGTTNHVIRQSHALAEGIIESLSDTLTEHLKGIHKTDYISLVEASKQLNSAISKYDKDVPVEIKQALATLMSVTRAIEVKQAKNALAVEAQMNYARNRLDKEDKHIMMSDIQRSVQLALPLPRPEYGEDIRGVE